MLLLYSKKKKQEMNQNELPCMNEQLILNEFDRIVGEGKYGVVRASKKDPTTVIKFVRTFPPESEVIQSTYKIIKDLKVKQIELDKIRKAAPNIDKNRLVVDFYKKYFYKNPATIMLHKKYGRQWILQSIKRIVMIRYQGEKDLCKDAREEINIQRSIRQAYERVQGVIPRGYVPGVKDYCDLKNKKKYSCLYKMERLFPYYINKDLQRDVFRKGGRLGTMVHLIGFPHNLLKQVSIPEEDADFIIDTIHWLPGGGQRGYNLSLKSAINLFQRDNREGELIEAFKTMAALLSMITFSTRHIPWDVEFVFIIDPNKRLSWRLAVLDFGLCENIPSFEIFYKEKRKKGKWKNMSFTDAIALQLFSMIIHIDWYRPSLSKMKYFLLFISAYITFGIGIIKTMNSHDMAFWVLVMKKFYELIMTELYSHQVKKVVKTALYIYNNTWTINFVKRRRIHSLLSDILRRKPGLAIGIFRKHLKFDFTEIDKNIKSQNLIVSIINAVVRDILSNKTQIERKNHQYLFNQMHPSQIEPIVKIVQNQVKILENWIFQKDNAVTFVEVYMRNYLKEQIQEKEKEVRKKSRLPDWWPNMFRFMSSIKPIGIKIDTPEIGIIQDMMIFGSRVGKIKHIDDLNYPEFLLMLHRLSDEEDRKLQQVVLNGFNQLLNSKEPLNRYRPEFYQKVVDDHLSQTFKNKYGEKYREKNIPQILAFYYITKIFGYEKQMQQQQKKIKADPIKRKRTEENDDNDKPPKKRKKKKEIETDEEFREFFDEDDDTSSSEEEIETITRRGKSTRRRRKRKKKKKHEDVEGMPCDECKKFFEAATKDMNPKEKREIMRRCKHCKHKRKRPLTPPGFFDIGFFDEPQEEEKKKKKPKPPPRIKKEEEEETTTTTEDEDIVEVIEYKPERKEELKPFPPPRTFKPKKKKKPSPKKIKSNGNNDDDDEEIDLSEYVYEEEEYDDDDDSDLEFELSDDEEEELRREHLKRMKKLEKAEEIDLGKVTFKQLSDKWKRK